MSHLQLVMAYKNDLANNGVSCPVLQACAVKEGYVRALIRHAATRGRALSVEEDPVWFQLEKWNNVSPIPATEIFETARYRQGVLANALQQEGRLPCSKTWAPEIQVDGVAVECFNCESFTALVNHLTNEMVVGHE